jgi:hypothetical protein
MYKFFDHLRNPVFRGVIQRNLIDYAVVLWLRLSVTGLIPRRRGFDSTQNCVGSVMKNWHWDKFLSDYFDVSLPVIIPPALRNHI